MRSPFPLPFSALDVHVSCLALAVTLHPSLPLALALAAVAGARTLERYFVDLARAYRNSTIDAREAADRAATSSEKAEGAVRELSAALDARVTRLESRASWADNGRGARP